MNLEAEVAALRRRVEELEQGCQERDAAIVILLATVSEGSLELALASTMDEKSLAAGGVHQTLVERMLEAGLTKRFALAAASLSVVTLLS